MITNTELADALDQAIEIISLPEDSWGFVRYTCVAACRLAEQELITKEVADKVEKLIADSIKGYYTFGSYYRHEINENEYDAVIHQKRIEHMKALSARIRNGEL